METVTALKTVLAAPDIECDGCASAIKKALAKVAGVSDVTVDVGTKTVRVQHDAAVSEIIDTLARIGFPVTVKG